MNTQLRQPSPSWPVAVLGPLTGTSAPKTEPCPEGEHSEWRRKLVITVGPNAVRHRSDNFNGLVLKALGGFTNCPSIQVGSEIDSSLRSICQHLGIERASLWCPPGTEAEAIALTHLYTSPNQIPLHGPFGAALANCASHAPHSALELRACFPWLSGQVLAGRTVTFASVTELPAEAEIDKQALAQLGTRSAAILPLLVDGKVVGAVSFALTRQERSWPEPLVQKLQLVAQVLGTGVARQLREERLATALHEAQEFKTALNAHAMVVITNLEGRIRYGNERFYQRAKYSPEELVGKDFSELSRGLYPGEFFVDLWSTVRRGEVWRGELKQTAKDGSCYWQTATLVPQLDEQGRPREYVGIGFDVTEQKLAEEALSQSHREVEQLKERLQKETDCLKLEVKLNQSHGEILGRSDGIRRVLHQVEQVAPVDCTVLITGETGTGKELIARAIHRLSRRRDKAMVTVNCAALPPTLVESELFGRERGAFTGALTSEVGRFELADGATIFLDEIGELSPEIQAKLLRILQDGEFQRLGNPKTRKVNVRVIAATNQDLAKAVREGRFREDLFYRLRVFPINVPPLRERLEDLPLLVSAFVEEFSRRMSKQVKRVPRQLVEQMQQHSWPGNIRELRNVIERGVILTPADTLVLPPLTDPSQTVAQPDSLEEVDRAHIIKTLGEAGWRVKGPFGAAKRLHLNPSTLYSRMAKLGIHRKGPRFTAPGDNRGQAGLSWDQ